MKVLVLLVLLCVVTAGSAGAQDLEPARHVVASTKSKTRYQVDVLRVSSTVAPAPAGYKLPVIYVLDGNSLFPLAGYLANAIVTFSNRLPAVLVVAIGYPAEPGLSRAENVKNRLSARTRDFSPGGGAAEFLAFIRDDLKPFLAERYATDPQDQTLVGHSLGGLFTIHTFLNAPQTFARYVAVSPSLFMDDHASIKQVATLSAPPGPTRLFIAVGGLETKERMGEDMIGDAQSFASALRNRNLSGLDVSFHLFPDENHISVVPGALSRGLSVVQALR